MTHILISMRDKFDLYIIISTLQITDVIVRFTPSLLGFLQLTWVRRPKSTMLLPPSMISKFVRLNINWDVQWVPT